MPPTSEHAVAAPNSGGDVPKPPRGVFKRLTSKLRTLSQSHIPDVVFPAHPGQSSPPLPASDPTDPNKLPSSPEIPSTDKTKRKGSRRLLSLPSLPSLPQPSKSSSAGMYASLYRDMENDWSSATKREAALRASGLVPARPKPGKDLNGYPLPLSELETQLDSRYAVVVAVPEGAGCDDDDSEDSEAKRIRREWIRRNKEQERVLVQEPEEQELDDILYEREEAYRTKIAAAHTRRRTTSTDSANDVFHDALEAPDDEPHYTSTNSSAA